MNVGDIKLNEAETFYYLKFLGMFDTMDQEDCPIDDKIGDLDELLDGLKEYKQEAAKAFPLLFKKIIEKKVELARRKAKLKQKKEEKKKNAAAFKIQGMYKTKKAKNLRCNLKIRKILDEHLQNKISEPLKKLEELALKKSSSTGFEIQKPSRSVLKPDGKFKVPKGERFALSKYQQEFWSNVDKEVLNAPPGFKHVKPTGKPPHNKDGKPIGGRKRKKSRKKKAGHHEALLLGAIAISKLFKKKKKTRKKRRRKKRRTRKKRRRKKRRTRKR